jgi:hypothetical protein
VGGGWAWRGAGVGLGGARPDVEGRLDEGLAASAGLALADTGRPVPPLRG